jgi:tripartite-type tricarboxylate transporter receptor subunit TctC
LPDTPTFAELGFPEVVAEVSWGIIAAARTAPAAIAGMHAALAAALSMPDARQQIEGAMAMRVIASTPAGYTRRIAADIERWTALVRQYGLRVEQ